MDSILNAQSLLQKLRQAGIFGGSAEQGAQPVPVKPDESGGMLSPSGVAPGGQGTAVGTGASSPGRPDELPLNLRTGPSSTDMPAEDFLKSLPSPNSIPRMAAPQLPQEPNYPAPPQMASLRGGIVGHLVAGLAGLGGVQNPFEAQRQQQFKDAMANWQAQVGPMKEKYQESLQQAELAPRLQTEQIQNEMALRRMAMMSGGFGREAIGALGQLSPQEQAILKSAMAEGDPKALAGAISHIDLQRNITGRNAMLARQTMGNVLAKAGVTPEMDLARTTKTLQAAAQSGQITPKEYDDIQSFLSTQPFLPGARLSYAETFTQPREELNRILQGRLNLSQAEEGTRLFDPALGASTRLARMSINVPKAMAGNQQAMVALLMDHIGMTLGLQRGARITRDAILNAEQSRGLVSGASSYLNFVKDPATGEQVLNWQDPVRRGTTLTPQQISQMIDLGQEQHRVMWTNARSQAAQTRSYGVPVNEPEDIMDALAPGMTLQAPSISPVAGKGTNKAGTAARPSLDEIFKQPQPR